MKKLLFLTIFIFLSSCSYAYAQTEPTVTIPQSVADSCSKCFDKSEAQAKVIDSLTAELATNKDLRAKEETYNAELLKAVALLTSSEKRNKSFFRKLEEQLGNVLKAATDPRQLAAIVSLILITKQLKK